MAGKKRTVIVRFQEVVTYEVTFTTTKTLEELQQNDEQGVDLWFVEMDRRAKGWAVKNLLRVDERQLLDIEEAGR